MYQTDKTPYGCLADAALSSLDFLNAFIYNSLEELKKQKNEVEKHMNTNDSASIHECIQNYIDGTFEADIEKLKRCFAPQAVMNGFLNGGMMCSTPQPFIDDIASSPSMKEQNCSYEAAILSETITGQIASVIVKETGFRNTATMENHFHLMKMDGQWKIVSKLFTTL